MIDAQIWYKSLNLAAITTLVMGAIAVILVKIADSTPKHKSSHKR